MRPLSRRELLTGSAASALVGCGASSPSRASIGASRLAPRVVVIGAGLAGLSVAHRLLGAGIEPLVLEAQDRVGGRILTVRAPFHEGRYVEAGATHVVGDPALLALMRELRVERFEPTRPSPSPRVLLRGGARAVLPVGAAPPSLDPLTPEESALEFTELWSRAMGEAIDGDPREPGWAEGERGRLDGIPLSLAVRQRGGSDALARMLATDIGMGAPADELSALWIAQQLAAIRLEMTWAGGGRIRGGSDRLPEALAARLGDRVVRRAVARVVRVDAGGALVRFERDGRLEELACERVVVAVPASLVREITFQPGLTTQAHLALHAIRMASVVRGWVELDREVWSDEGVSGSAWTDDPYGDLRAMRDLGSPTILGTYASADAARAITALAPEERSARLRALVERAHPAAVGHITATHVHAWDEDPWARGAYAWMAVGVLTGVLPGVLQPMAPHRRVHFAGDWCSHRPGFMHGALASADRAAREVLAAA